MSISKVYQDNPINQALSQIQSYSLSKLEALFRIEKFNKRRDFKPTRSDIAPHHNVKTATFWTNDFHEHGLIVKTENPKKPFDTCHYEITPLFQDLKPYIREIWKLLKYIPLTISVCSFVAKPDVTPMKEFKGKESSDCYPSPTLYLKTVTNCPTVLRELQTACERAREKQPPKKDFRVEMQAMPDWVNPQIKQATQLLSLTKWGQIKLTAYPPSAIEYAMQAFKNSKGKKDNPFTWFASVCHSWCKQKNMHPDWALMNRLSVSNQMPQDPELIVESSIVGEVKNREQKATLHQAHEERAAQLLATEREKMRAKQAAWEAKQSKEKSDVLMAAVVPGMESLMEFAGASHADVERVRNLNPQNGMTKALQQLPELQPELPSVEEIKDLDVKFDFVKKIRLKSNLNEFEKCVMTNAVRIIDEAKKKYRITDRWNYDEKPSWPKQDEELIAWSLDFLEYTLKQDYSNEWYVNLKKEIEMGPSSPRAQNRELQQGLALMRSLLKKEPVNDAKEPGSNDALLHRHGTGTLEESRMQFQQESAF